MTTQTAVQSVGGTLKKHQFSHISTLYFWKLLLFVNQVDLLLARATCFSGQVACRTTAIFHEFTTLNMKLFVISQWRAYFLFKLCGFVCYLLTASCSFSRAAVVGSISAYVWKVKLILFYINQWPLYLVINCNTSTSIKMLQVHTRPNLPLFKYCMLDIIILVKLQYMFIEMKSMRTKCEWLRIVAYKTKYPGAHL